MGGAALLLLFGYSSGGAITPTGPGRLEYTLPAERPEYRVPELLCEFTLPEDRSEYAARIA